MKCRLLVLFLFLAFYNAHSMGEDSTLRYHLPDSVKAVQVIANVTIQSYPDKKEGFTGLSASGVTVFLRANRSKKFIGFRFPANASVVTTGMNIKKNETELSFAYPWNSGEVYKLLIASASDSAGNFSLYSGYIWLPKDNRWKFIGTCKLSGQWNNIREPATIFKSDTKAIYDSVWVQRSNNSWKNLEGKTGATPIINLLSHIDSLPQLARETVIIKSAISGGKTDVKDQVEGIYYKIINPGTGRQVSVDDTVTVYYKLTLFQDTAVIDGTKDKPAVFPLKRLIRGWQLVVPLLKTGGKIKIVIPSSQAYSIRTRAARIPPNSILEFEVEVVDTKPPAGK